jgi:hypothetical protein
VTPGPEKGTPNIDDYEWTGLKEYVTGETIEKVEVKQKVEGKGAPVIAVKYSGSTAVPPASNRPTAFAVTFDVGGADWNSATFYAGTINVNDSGLTIPTSDNFTVSWLPTTINLGAALPTGPITSNVPGYTPTITTIKYALKGGQPAATVPTTTVGEYNVFFDVPAFGTTWGSKNDLRAGSFFVRDPGSGGGDEEEQVTVLLIGDFTYQIGTRAGDVFTDEATPKTVIYTGSPLEVTVKADSPAGRSYPLSANPAIITYTRKNAAGQSFVVSPPVDKNTYFVNVRLADVVDQTQTPRQAWKGFSLNFTLVVDPKRPEATDYDITNVLQAEAGTLLSSYSVKHINIVGLADLVPPTGVSSPGDIKFYYEYIPMSKPVTADAAADAALETDLVAKWDGTKEFVSGDLGTAGTFNSTWANNTQPPQRAGKYKVTFTVAAPAVGTDTPGNWIGTGTTVADRLVACDEWELRPLNAVRPVINEMFWIDDGKLKVTTGNNVLLLVPPETLQFTATVSNDYEVIEWLEDGRVAQTGGTTYTFTKTAIGLHDVTLVVKAKGADAKRFSETVQIRVQEAR